MQTNQKDNGTESEVCIERVDNRQNTGIASGGF